MSNLYKYKKNVKNKYNELIDSGIIPIKQWGYPEDVAKAVFVYCSGKLVFSIGEIIKVDGSFHLKGFRYINCNK